MNRILTLAFALSILAPCALAAETPPHTIAVAGEAELLLPPDFATIELGVITQGAAVSDAIAENSARMTRVIEAIKSLGVLDKDIQTSNFVIQPKYQKTSQTDFDQEGFRTIVGYYVSNKVTLKIRNLGQVSKAIDESVKAGANTSGTVYFDVDAISGHFDDARRAAIENAYHKAKVLTDAAHIQLGSAISITDNRADTSYNDRAEAGSLETVVVTAERRSTPIESGLVTIHSVVTVVYETR